MRDWMSWISHRAQQEKSEPWAWHLEPDSSFQPNSCGRQHRLCLLQIHRLTTGFHSTHSISRTSPLPCPLGRQKKASAASIQYGLLPPTKITFPPKTYPAGSSLPAPQRSFISPLSVYSLSLGFPLKLVQCPPLPLTRILITMDKKISLPWRVFLSLSEGLLRILSKWVTSGRTGKNLSEEN